MTAPYNPRQNFRQCHERGSENAETYGCAGNIFIYGATHAGSEAGTSFPNESATGSRPSHLSAAPGLDFGPELSSTLAPLDTTQAILLGQGHSLDNEDRHCRPPRIRCAVSMAFLSTPPFAAPYLPARSSPVRPPKFRGTHRLLSPRFPTPSKCTTSTLVILLTSEPSCARTLVVSGIHRNGAGGAMTPAPRTVPLAPALKCDL